MSTYFLSSIGCPQSSWKNMSTHFLSSIGCPQSSWKNMSTYFLSSIGCPQSSWKTYQHTFSLLSGVRKVPRNMYRMHENKCQNFKHELFIHWLRYRSETTYAADFYIVFLVLEPSSWLKMETYFSETLASTYTSPKQKHQHKAHRLETLTSHTDTLLYQLSKFCFVLMLWHKFNMCACHCPTLFHTVIRFCQTCIGVFGVTLRTAFLSVPFGSCRIVGFVE
jgi:hypothetical protein